MFGDLFVKVILCQSGGGRGAISCLKGRLLLRGHHLRHDTPSISQGNVPAELPSPCSVQTWLAGTLEPAAIQFLFIDGLMMVNTVRL